MTKHQEYPYNTEEKLFFGTMGCYGCAACIFVVCAVGFVLLLAAAVTAGPGF